MSQNQTFIDCLGKTGQDQHLKLSPWSRILFYEAFFDKDDCKPPKVNICGRNSSSPLRHPFFPWSSPFQNLGLKVVPQQKGGGWYCEKRSVMKRSITFKLSLGPLNLVKNVTNDTHVKKVENTSEFRFGIFWLTWKTTIY